MTKGDLILEGIRKTYEGAEKVSALVDVTLTVERGQFLALLGPSGCGKTTLLRIASGFIAPTAGRVLVRGEDVTGLPPQRRPTAMVFQNYALFPHMTAAANIAFGLSVRRLAPAEIKQRVQNALSLVGLDGLGDRFPRQMSGGQQQRVALARAIAIEPPVLLMDEPLGALDAKLREEMQYELRTIQQRLGITVLYVTHDQEEAFSMCDQVAVMNRGRVLQVGSAEEIYHRPNTAFVARFVGRSNLLHGTAEAGGEQVRVGGGLTVTAPLPRGVWAGTPVLLVIRPEDISLRSANPGDNRVDGIVERRLFIGGSNRYFVRLANGAIMVAEDSQSPPLSANAPVRLSWPSGRSIVLKDDYQPD
jgi:putative spermidine/putrescine transport system ATP-binding protein